MTANDRTSVGAGSAEWQTPPALFRALNRRYCFNYDAFASHENALLPMYSTVAGTFVKHAYWTGALSSDTGLEYDWADLRVYMNPPYSRGLIDKCVKKAFDERERAAIIVALLPASTDTQWFQKYIFPACDIEWLPKRVRYIDPTTGQPGGSPPSGSIIAVFKSGVQW